ncbi:SH3 domain-containing protein [Streptomyces sp. V4-01]|uniref:SH3 domain-containing protein n=1 Tax=Actinacidiphila polyblastidii TaxID=3110430 RepID=A0ABU7PG93_9ACTN|nr:SH3 domain-containing protein [Streptomyces sp. V4-01]
MQRPATSKFLTTVALTAGAAALSVLGGSPAGASPVDPSPVSAGQAAHSSAQQPSAAQPAAPQPAAAHVDGRVVSNLPLTIRSLATTNSTALGSYAPGTIVHIACKKNGQTVDGNPRWYKLSDRTGWLAARYVVNLGTVPWC